MWIELCKRERDGDKAGNFSKNEKFNSFIYERKLQNELEGEKRLMNFREGFDVEKFAWRIYNRFWSFSNWQE